MLVLPAEAAIGGRRCVFFQAEDGIRDCKVTGVQTCALPILGYFSAPVTNVHALRSLAGTADTSNSLEYRVRSYLAANCAQCHQPGGPSAAAWDEIGRASCRERV